MLETVAIIVALGGLELTLWLLDRKRAREQTELLEAIWVELATLNGAEGESKTHTPPAQPSPAPSRP